jgi:hypothetical protein
MLIDCETCRAPENACRDCVVTVLLNRPPAPVELDDSEWDAIGNLVQVGLVPPLRMTPDSPASPAVRRSRSRRAGRDIA